MTCGCQYVFCQWVFLVFTNKLPLDISYLGFLSSESLMHNAKEILHIIMWNFSLRFTVWPFWINKYWSMLPFYGPLKNEEHIALQMSVGLRI